MSVSAFFGSRLVVPPAFSAATKAAPPPQRLLSGGGHGGCGLVIECSSRPEKKATKHHMKTRPKKTRPSDIRRRPTVYAPLPPLPPEWSLVSDHASPVAADPPQPVQSE